MIDDLYAQPNRMSILGVTEFCGLAGILASRYGAGRSAAMGQAWHARISGAAPPALTDEEREEVSSWSLPTETEARDGTKLRIADAEKELEVKLPLPDGRESVGHLDFAWVVPLQRLKGESCRVAYIGDGKRSLFTSTGPSSLQLLAYGAAFARQRDCDYYTTGIFVAETGEWHWLPEVIRVGGERDRNIVLRVAAAATNLSSTGSHGAHCRDCWSRLHCPEWTTASEETDVPDLTERLLRAQARLEIAERTIKNIQEAVRRGEASIKDTATGKRYLPINMPGRKSLDRDALMKELPEASRFEKTGKPYQQFRWLNDREK